jgi:hypothetical protein
MVLTLENWKTVYRQKYEGANVWSSKAIDSQIEDIERIAELQRQATIAEKEKELWNRMQKFEPYMDKDDKALLAKYSPSQESKEEQK